MKGFIKIETASHKGYEGLSVTTNLEYVTPADRLHVVCCLCEALEIAPEELAIMAGFLSSGLKDEMFGIEVIEQEIQRVSVPASIINLWSNTLGKEADNEG